MYRTIVTTVALLFILILTSHGQANAVIAEAPHAVSAKSIPGNQISVSFDRQLNNSELSVGDFHISTPNIYVMEASVLEDKVILLLTQSIHNESNVLLTIDGGAVATHWSEVENDAVSNLRVITPASAIHLKNTLDPNKTGFSVEHIIRYMASANPQNVYGTSVFNHEDIRYLLSLIEGVNSNKSMLNEYYSESSYLLSSTPNYPYSIVRDTLSNAISAAQAVLNQPNSKQRQVDEALMTLMNAQNEYLSRGYSFLETDQTDSGLEIIGNMIYVPSGMSVPTLISKLTPAVEIHANADNSTLITSGNVTRKMKVVVSNSPSQIYHIKIQAAVSTIEQLHLALADTSVSIIKLEANITSTGEIHINHHVHFSATEAYTIAVRNILNNTGFSWDNNVTFLKNVNSEAELLAALNTTGDIEVIGEIAGFTGLLKRVNSGDYQYYRNNDNTRAFVSYVDHFQDALSDAQVTNIYIAQNIYVDDTLTFPERSIVLSGPASGKSTIRANSITNTLTGDSEAINIVNASAPRVTYMSWGNGNPGELDMDQVITLRFSSALDVDTRQRVEQALVTGASYDEEGLSVVEATYLDFDWYDSDITLDMRNVEDSIIYFPEDIYAQLSDLPYSNVKILDPTPFRAYIIPNLDQRVLEVVFNQTLTNTTLSLYHADEIIESLNFTRYEEGIQYTHPIYYTTITWDTTDHTNPKLLIYFSAEDINYGDQINLIFKSGSIRSEDNEAIYNAISYAG